MTQSIKMTMELIGVVTDKGKALLDRAYEEAIDNPNPRGMKLINATLTPSGTKLVLEAELIDDPD